MNKKINMDKEDELDNIIREIIEKGLGNKDINDDGYTTKDEIGHVISEEYGISKQVTGKVHEVCGWIENDIRGRKADEVRQDGISVYGGKVPINCFGSKYTIMYTVYDYKSRQSYLMGGNKMLDGNTNGQNRTIAMNMNAINKTITNDSKMLMQHELHHCMEKVKISDEKSLGNHKYRPLYNNAIIYFDKLKMEKEEGNKKESLLRPTNLNIC